MAKKSINDTDFFSDENLDALSEDVEVVDPDAVVDTEPVDDAEVVDDSEVVVDDTTDDVVVDTETAEVVTPDPHLPDDPEALKVMYSEVRKHANQQAMAVQKAQERIAQLEADLTEFDYEPESEYDAQAFTQIATQDPRAAFQYAMQAGNSTDAATAIAQVQADAMELAGLAAIAHRDGDQDAYAQLRAQATNANALAQSMQGEVQQVNLRVQQAPLVEAERARNLAAAEAHLAQSNADYTTRRGQVIEVLRQRPNLITGHSAEQIAQGLSDAYAIASRQPAPAGVGADIDSVVAAAVAKHIEATRAAKKAAAGAASGGAGSRVSPGDGLVEASPKDAIYSQQSAAGLGARSFMDL